MIVVIIAGGSGTRLWPLSQGDHPKHLLKLTGDRSLLQNTYQRARAVAELVYVVTEQSHASEVRLQLPEVPDARVIVEPGRRGTASCFALALAVIARDNIGDESVLFMHADHHIVDEESFTRTVKCAAAESAKHRSITLIGIKPTYPATGFGYIECAQYVEIMDGLEVSQVSRFVEKPDLETASTYLAEDKYLWNMGLFAAPPSVFQEAFSKYAPELEDAYLNIKAALGEPAKLADAYLALGNQAIDTALVEKMPNLLVVGGTFDWADIGSFFDLHNILQDGDKKSLSGDVQLIDCDDVMIHGYSKPVVAIGLTGIVVVDSPEGLLVCAKDKSQLVGEVAKLLENRKTQA